MLPRQEAAVVLTSSKYLWHILPDVHHLDLHTLMWILLISFSNISLKLNAKLSNSINNARAWQIGDYRGRSGMPWISEANTLIMGIAMARGAF